MNWSESDEWWGRSVEVESVTQLAAPWAIRKGFHVTGAWCILRLHQMDHLGGPKPRLELPLLSGRLSFLRRGLSRLGLRLPHGGSMARRPLARELV